MLIFPTQFNSEGRATSYASGPVRTIIHGHREITGSGYEGRTMAEVIRLAVLNSQIRRMSAGLVQN